MVRATNDLLWKAFNAVMGPTRHEHDNARACGGGMSYMRPLLRNLTITSQHLGLSLKLALVAFVAQSSSLESLDNALYGSSLWVAPLGAPRFGIYVTQTLIGDIFMVSVSSGYSTAATLNGALEGIQVISGVEQKPEGYHLACDLMPRRRQ